MPILPTNTEYTDLDFDSMRARLVLLATSVFPDWTDFDNPRNMGNLFLEMDAFIVDAIAYIMEKSARESRVLTAAERKNMISLLRLINYELDPASAATVDETFSLQTPPLADVFFAAGTVVRTTDVTEPVEFRTVADAVILQGADPPEVTVSVENAEPQVQLVQSTLSPSQRVLLDRPPFVDVTLVTAGNGTYTQVATFFDSTATDLHFQVLVDQNDRATLLFGNGILGAIPEGSIEVEYKTGGGASGNVDLGTLTVVPGSFTDTEGRAVRVFATNAAKASGGDDRETVEQARVAGPASLRSLNRTVASDDFKTHSEAVPGVSRALILTSDEDLTIAENSGIVFVVPDGGGLPSQALKDAVLVQVTETFPPPITFRVSVSDPLYLAIDVEARVTFVDDVVKTDVRDDIRSALVDLFALDLEDTSPNPFVAFGAEGEGIVAWSDVFNAVRDTVGVRRIAPGDLKLNELVADVSVGLREFPTLGDVIVRDAQTGLPV